MKRMLFIFVSSFLLIALAACAQETKSELDYDQTKKMIVDILKQIKVRKLFKMY